MKWNGMLYAVCLCVLGAAGPPLALHAQDGCALDEVLRESVLAGRRTLEIGHAEADGPGYARVNLKTPPGEGVPYPEVLSERHQDAIMRAREQYLSGDYRGAARTLEPAYEDEPGNLFILNEYARTLYWIDEQADQSLKVYRRLVQMLDEEADARLGSDVAYVDAWFIEAYWKLGTLYLEHGVYSLAIYEISRALLGSAGEAAALFLEQAFVFLSEAHLEIGQRQEARCFASHVLKLNPDHAEARFFLDVILAE